MMTYGQCFDYPRIDLNLDRYIFIKGEIRQKKGAGTMRKVLRRGVSNFLRNSKDFIRNSSEELFNRVETPALSIIKLHKL